MEHHPGDNLDNVIKLHNHIHTQSYGWVLFLFLALDRGLHHLTFTLPWIVSRVDMSSIYSANILVISVGMNSASYAEWQDYNSTKILSC
jgi:hypothetical protein